MGSVGWLRAAAPGSAPPPTNKLGLCSESVCQASDWPGDVGCGGKNTVERRAWEGVGVGGGEPTLQGASGSFLV